MPGARIIGVVCLAATLGGCATTRAQIAPALVWPPAPLTSRIQFVQALYDQEDLQGQRSQQPVGGWLKEAVLGRKTPPNSLRQPMGVAVSSDSSRIYVTDYAAPAVLVFDLNAKQTRPLGQGVVTFQRPLGVAVDAQQFVYVVDSAAKTVHVFGPDERWVRTITDERFVRPTGIAVDRALERIYVADSATPKSDQHLIRIFDLAGAPRPDFQPTGPVESRYLFPTYLALDAQSRLYVTDTLAACVYIFDPDGRYLRTIGERGDAYGMFDKPKGVAVDRFGNIYVVDSAWSNVQIFSATGQPLLFFGGRGDYPGLLFNPTAIAIDAQNRIYVADAFNGRVSVYQLMNTTSEDSFLKVEQLSERQSTQGGT